MRTEDNLLYLYISSPVFWCHTTSVDRSCGADLNTHVQLYCYNPSSVSFNLHVYKNPQKSHQMCPLQLSPSPVFLRRFNQLWVKIWTLCSPTISYQTLSKYEWTHMQKFFFCFFFKAMRRTGPRKKMLSECLSINWTRKRKDLSWLLDSFQHLYSICVRAQVQPNRHTMSLQQQK